jgi:hypothetical protein
MAAPRDFSKGPATRGNLICTPNCRANATAPTKTINTPETMVAVCCQELNAKLWFKANPKPPNKTPTVT